MNVIEVRNLPSAMKRPYIKLSIISQGMHGNPI
jgi:hypothetical protein